MPPQILVVEDDTATRESLRLMLEKAGCEVQMAADGQRAVDSIAARKFDAIILDLALPGMSGTDVMEHISRTTPQLLESVVVVTGLDASEIRQLFPSICETLSKPVLPARLIESVRRCVATGDGSGISVA